LPCRKSRRAADAPESSPSHSHRSPATREKVANEGSNRLRWTIVRRARFRASISSSGRVSERGSAQRAHSPTGPKADRLTRRCLRNSPSLPLKKMKSIKGCVYQSVAIHQPPYPHGPKP
jgi:hypothetical protein